MINKEINLLPLSFYKNNDVAEVAKQLLGKMLCTNFDGKFTSGMIVETEAYMAPEDKASHAYNNKMTGRNKVMFDEGGVAYIYLCYGLHHLFNVVTNISGIPHAVLIRAIEPIEGIGNILERKGKVRLAKNLVSGPGALSQALGITTKYNGISLYSESIYIQNFRNIQQQNIISAPRIGVNYAGEHAFWNFRFYIDRNPWVSRIVK